MSKHDVPVSQMPCPTAQEAEAASTRALDTVQEIFGSLNDDFDDEEPTMIRQLRNGGKARLQRRLRQGGFAQLQIKEVQSA